MEGDEGRAYRNRAPLLSVPLPDVQWGTITGGKPRGWVREGERRGGRGKAAARRWLIGQTARVGFRWRS